MAKNKSVQQTKNKKSFKFKGKKFNNKKISAKIVYDKQARLIVRNLSFKTSEKILKEHFCLYGDIPEVTLLKRPNGDLVGCGFVQFEDIESAKLALSKTNSKPFLGRHIQVDWAVSKDKFVVNNNNSKFNEKEMKTEKIEDDTSATCERLSLRPKISRKARLVVRNISFKANEENLKEHFSQYGEVLESTLLKKSNGELVGCGFIQMKNVKDAAQAIIKTNAQPFLGRPIHVDWAIAKNKYMSYVVQKKDEEELLKNDVKSEPESDDEIDDNKKDLQNVSMKDEPDDLTDVSKESDDSERSGSDDEMDVDENHEEKPSPDSLKVSANDAEDGKTVFLKNVPFNVTNEDLEEFMKSFGEIQYALVCIDKLKEYSKGSAFVRFKNKEDAEILLSSGPDRLTIEGQVMEAYPAMFRDRIKGKNSGKKQPKDSRNLYLIKEGVILANSKAAMGVSASDIAKRLSLEQNKSQMLRNLNRFVSRYRLTIHNLPLHYSDDDLKKICLEMANVKPYCLKECKVMRYLKGPLGPNGKHISKGYGFVMFTRHEDALTCLRRLNNHPSIFDINNRPIVSFSIEDKAILNARKKRLEKSQARNPLSKSYVPPEKAVDNLKTESKEFSNKNFKKGNMKTEKKSSDKPDNKKLDRGNTENYLGEKGVPGNTRMRSRFKLRNEAMMHNENVKKDKRKKRIAKRMEYVQKKEKLKPPKQKRNTNIKTKAKISTQRKEDKIFTDLVSKYKSKLVASSSNIPVKSKWFEQK